MCLMVKKGIVHNVLLRDTGSYRQMLGWRIPDGSWVNNVYSLSWITYNHPGYKPIFNFGDE